jgi:hypothetical protein
MGGTDKDLAIFPHSVCFWDILGGPENCNLHFWIPPFSPELVEKIFKGEDKKFVVTMKNLARLSVFCRGISGLAYWFKPNWVMKNNSISKGYTFADTPMFNTYVSPVKIGGNSLKLVNYLLSGMGSENFNNFSLDNYFGGEETISTDIFKNREWQRIAVVLEKEYKKIDPKVDIMLQWLSAIRGEVPNKVSVYFVHNNNIYAKVANEGKVFIPLPSWNIMSSFSNISGFNIGSLTTINKIIGGGDVTTGAGFTDPSLYGFTGVDGTVDEVAIYLPSAVGEVGENHTELSDILNQEDKILAEGRFNSKGGYFELPTLCFPQHTFLLGVHTNSYLTEDTKDFYVAVLFNRVQESSRKSTKKEFILELITHDINNKIEFPGRPLDIGGFISLRVGILPSKKRGTEDGRPLNETPYVDDITLYVGQPPLIFKKTTIKK